MIHSRAGIFSETAQASLIKHSLSGCNYDLYGLIPFEHFNNIFFLSQYVEPLLVPLKRSQRPLSEIRPPHKL